MAQSSTLDVIGSGTGLSGYAGFNDQNRLLSKNKVLEYGEIEGNCFWDDEWNSALLILTKGDRIKLKKVRLNFYSNDIHYLDKNDTEFTLLKGVINKIVFFDRKDTVKVKAVFQSFDNFKSLGTSYVQVLNEGKLQLLKMTAVSLKKNDYNQYRRKDIYRFVPKIKYFVHDNDNLTQLKSINKMSLLSIIKSNDEINEWLKSNNSKLKNEHDAIAFLNFYNSTNK